MKSILVSLLVPLSLWLPQAALSEECSQADIILATQAEVDAFQASFGPCDTITGSLTIGGSPHEANDISALDGLAGLRRVGNDLKIYHNANLASLSGLADLQSVGGSLDLLSNPSLINLAGLETLTEVGYDVRVSVNNALIDLGALSNLRIQHPAAAVISISGNASLEDLDGLQGINQVLGIEISGNPALEDLHGLEGLQHVGNRISIQQNNLLASIAALNGIEGEVGRIDLFNNANLEAIDGFRGVTSVQGWLIVQGHEKVRDLDGLANLQQVGDFFRILDAPLLNDISALAKLRSVSTLQITFSGLHSLAGLEALENVDEILAVNANESLSDCSALERVLDMIDHGPPGPGDGRPPDVGLDVRIQNNTMGCNGLFEIAPLPPAEDLLTGSWYDPASAGEGLMIHAVTEDVAVAYFYGYDDLGDRFWLIAVHEGSMGWSKPISFQATIVSGGNFTDFDPASIEERPWGTLTFSPRHCDAADIELRGPLGDKFLSATRLGRVAGSYCADAPTADGLDGLTGSWYDAATPGQGFAFHKIDETRGVVYYYGFDADGAPLWLIGPWTEPVQPGIERDVLMYRVTGGTYAQVDPAQIVEEPWGTLTLRMDDCTSGHGELNGLDGFQAMNLTLLASSLGLSCETAP